MNLIANTGIQYYTVPIEINLNDNFRMFFYEWFDIKDIRLKLEFAHKFSDDELWVKKNDLFELGYLIDGNISKGLQWDHIKEQFVQYGRKPISVTTERTEDSGCFQLRANRIKWDRFVNKWLPFPFFRINANNKSEFGPTNWCRFKLIPVEESFVHHCDFAGSTDDDNIKKYDLLLAFDTRSIHEDEDCEDEDLLEAPAFAGVSEKSKDFALCNDEIKTLSFCSPTRDCEWVHDQILKIYHGITDVDKLEERPKMMYLAQYIYVLQYIQRLNKLPKITLFSDRNVAHGDVDIAIDIGNSRTCVVLFDNSDFTKGDSLRLQDFSIPVKDGRLNKHSDSFDMRLAFREADFGGEFIIGSRQFIFPSMIRLGKEANGLIHKAVNMNTESEKTTTFSSPKRYLWDEKSQQREWEFVRLNEEPPAKPIWIDGISQQLNTNGSLNVDGSGGQQKFYSRKALMTFAFLEIMAQARMQINSYEYRCTKGGENVPRRTGRIIVTCPTAMSKIEQIALRKSAEDACIMLERFYSGTYNKRIDDKEARKKIKVVPSAKALTNREEPEWIYDEAGCVQFVFLYAEISKRYLNKCSEFFNLYGHVRNDLGKYDKKSLTIGSVDIGAGTTDVMIAAYKYDDAGQCTLTPTPLFWESFYFAGDDLMKELIRLLVIEGNNAAIEKRLTATGKTSEITALNARFFGENTSAMSVQDRQLRNEFNLQASVPIVQYFLEILRKNKDERATFTFDVIFADSKPTQRVLEHFAKHFGFPFESLTWEYDKNVLTNIIERTFDSLVGKISTVLAYYTCDIVVLSGRPTSLKPLTDLFVKYYPVSPNRLKLLNDYRVGRWYPDPRHDADGYFANPKSFVAVGAMIGNCASARGSLNGFSLNLEELGKKLKPTSEYFAKLNERTLEFGETFITPSRNTATMKVSTLPVRIGCRQWDVASYPSRPLYVLDFDENKIEERVKTKHGLSDAKQIKDAVEIEKQRIRKQTPLVFTIEREDYQEDKESLRIELVEVDATGDELPVSYFSLQIQSMSESENYWLDTGEFSNLNITKR